MIGQVAFIKSGVRRLASLREDGTWSVSPPLADPDIDATLAWIASRYAGPSAGPFGPAQLRDAAIYLRLSGFKVTSTYLEPKTPAPPGTIF